MVKRLAKTCGVLVVMGAAITGVLWLLKDRISGPDPTPVAPDEAPRFRVAPHPQPEADEPAEPAAQADDLAAVKGIGPVFKARLIDEGVTTFTDLAAVDAASLADQIGASESQVADWVSQAADLAT